MRIEVGFRREDDDQGGHWLAWADELHIDIRFAGGLRHECFVTNQSQDLRNALWPVIEAAVRRAEPSDVDQLRRRNAELEQRAVEQDAVIARDTELIRTWADRAKAAEQALAEIEHRTLVTSPPGTTIWRWRCTCGTDGVGFETDDQANADALKHVTGHHDAGTTYTVDPYIDPRRCICDQPARVELPCPVHP